MPWADLTGNIDGYSRFIADAYEQATVDVLKLVTKRLEAGADAPDWAKKKLGELKGVMAEVGRALPDMSPAVQKLVNEAYEAGGQVAAEELALAMLPSQAPLARGSALKALGQAVVAGQKPDYSQLTTKQLRDMAKARGVSLNLTKAEIVAALDELEPGVAHDGLTGQSLADAAAKYNLPKLKSKAQLAEALANAAAASVQATHFQILRNVEDGYKGVVAQVAAKHLTGVNTLQQAIQEGLKGLADKGFTGFVDASGKRWALPSYVEMAMRTACLNAAREGHANKLESVGLDLVRISRFGATCPLCGPWEGKIVSLSGNTKGYRSLADAKAAGLFHPNCRHHFTAYIPGLSPEDNDVQVPYDPEAYAAEQKQRYIERQIRRWKRREAVATTEQEATTCRKRLTGWQAANRQHITETNEWYEAKYGPHTQLLRRRYERERLYQPAGGLSSGSALNGPDNPDNTGLNEALHSHAGGFTPTPVAEAPPRTVAAYQRQQTSGQVRPFQGTGTTPDPDYTGLGASFTHIGDGQIKTGIIKQVNADTYDVQYTGSSGNLKTVSIPKSAVTIDKPAPTVVYAEPAGRGQPWAASVQAEIDSAAEAEARARAAAETAARRAQERAAQAAARRRAKAEEKARAKEAQRRLDELTSNGSLGTLGLNEADLAHLEDLQGLGGSTGARLVQDRRTGQKYVLKKGANPEHIRSEVCADALYKYYGANVPDFSLIETADGPVKVSRFIEDAKPLSSFTGAQRKRIHAALAQDFHLDALMGNWDVIGQDADNILVEKIGSDLVPWRIDNGGSLAFRAQGDRQGKTYGPHVGELRTMRRAKGATGAQAQAAKVFADLPDDIFDRMEALADPHDALLGLLDQQTAVSLRGRAAEMRELGALGKSMTSDIWGTDYSMRLVGAKAEMRAKGVFETLPTKLSHRPSGDPTRPVDDNGQPFDNIRGRTGVTTSNKLRQYAVDQVGEQKVLTYAHWADSQSGSSWSGTTLQAKSSLAKAMKLDPSEFFLNGQRLNSGLDEDTLDCFTIYHAATHEVLAKVALPNSDLTKGTLKLCRTQCREAVQGLDYRGAPGVIAHSPAESAAMFKRVTVSGWETTLFDDVPMHRVLSSYLLDRPDGYTSGMFLGDGENEVVAALSKLPCRYVDETVWRAEGW